jgi:hypothetical protein
LLTGLDKVNQKRQACGWVVTEARKESNTATVTCIVP